jgi:hypothetical protein
VAGTVTLLLAVSGIIALVWLRTRRARPAHHPDDLGKILARGKRKQRGFRPEEHPGQDGGTDGTGAR